MQDFVVYTKHSQRNLHVIENSTNQENEKKSDK